MLDKLYNLYYDMKARGLEPGHWIIGIAIEPDILQLRTPDGDWVAQAGSIQQGPTALGLPWKIDRKHPTRLELSPSPHGGIIVRDVDGSLLITSETESADKLLRSLLD